jgi:hypothetical protein
MSRPRLPALLVLVDCSGALDSASVIAGCIPVSSSSFQLRLSAAASSWASPLVLCSSPLLVTPLAPLACLACRRINCNSSAGAEWSSWYCGWMPAHLSSAGAVRPSLLPAGVREATGSMETVWAEKRGETTNARHSRLKHDLTRDANTTRRKEEMRHWSCQPASGARQQHASLACLTFCLSLPFPSHTRRCEMYG